MDYLGRSDDQIKIRGHRVELGEIEAVLADHPDVTRAVVVYQADPDGGQLQAVVHLRPGAGLTDVEAHAARQLPTWMRPSGYTVVDSIPLTVGGKADRGALMTRLNSARDGAEAGEEEKENAVKANAAEIIRAVWCDVLKVDKVEETDDFFEIGGHSLTAMQVASRLRAALDGTKVPTRMLFTHRTFGAFTAAVNERLNEVAPA
ncbi:MAG TPA: phosphopantetheine-binding protein [Micromonosporaceae bacterium]|nr:phosphopantetheine-binding protein [Micromonosporaceae bacterium]